MPELPEVEIVRAGVAEHVAGRRIREVEVLHPRSVRRYGPGPEEFCARLRGARVHAVRRRGKYLWLELGCGQALLGHLGMSGQFRVQPPEAPDEAHLRVRISVDSEGVAPGQALAGPVALGGPALGGPALGGPGAQPGAGMQLRFVDQRTFGGLLLTETVPVGGTSVPREIAHIARDPIDPAFAPEAAIASLRSRRTEVKRALLDQSLVSGIGNIYADEALWRARLHGARPTDRLTRAQCARLFDAVRQVLEQALAAGGTSFDALYVNVNGRSGYFGRSLEVYGKRGEPCTRCQRPIQREPFMNRSSYICPGCQRRPRAAASRRPRG